MARLRRSKPFVEDWDNMLWIGLIAQNSGIPASQRLNITDEVLALDFDAAVAQRMIFYENERMVNQAKLIAIEVGKMLGGSSED